MKACTVSRCCCSIKIFYSMITNIVTATNVNRLMYPPKGAQASPQASFITQVLNVSSTIAVTYVNTHKNALRATRKSGDDDPLQMLHAKHWKYCTLL